jgi:hypothetical protein
MMKIARRGVLAAPDLLRMLEQVSAIASKSADPPPISNVPALDAPRKQVVVSCLLKPSSRS